MNVQTKEIRAERSARTADQTPIGRWSPANDGAILSKEDAAAMFALSKSEWNDNVLAVSLAGAATAIKGPSDVLTMGTGDRSVSYMVVAPSYDDGDPRPLFLQIMVVYPHENSIDYTGEAASHVTARARQEMKPEYDVVGTHADTDLGFEFTFFVRETGH